MYLTETHFHTSLVSPCAKVPPEEAVAAYAERGYTTLVVTDHYNRWIYDYHGCEDPQAWVELFLSGYRRICEIARDYPEMQVLLGMELHLTENCNDLLVYGVTEQDLHDAPMLYDWSLRELRAYADKKGWLIIHAHPFRDGLTVLSPSYVDGVEVYNGNPRHNSRNEIARHWARLHGLLMTAGSDYHEREDVARGGLLTIEPITTIEELQAAIRKGAGLYLQNN